MMFKIITFVVLPMRLIADYQRRKRVVGAAIVAVAALIGTQAKADIIHFTAYGTYTGVNKTVDGVALITGATASQAYTLDTVTKTGSAVETITSGANTYQFTASNMGTSSNSFDFFIGGGVSPHTFGFELNSPVGAPALQSDLSNLSGFFAAFNTAGSSSPFTAFYATDNAPEFHLDLVAVVPEPMSLALWAAGGFLLALRRRQRIGTAA